MACHFTKQLKILIVEDLRQIAARESLRGILRFAALHENWHVSIAHSHPANGPVNFATDFPYDGIIADFSWRSLQRYKRSIARPKAAVFLDLPLPSSPPTRNYGYVVCDNNSIALNAAQFFLKRGFANFAFIGSPKNEQWSRERFRYFDRQIRARGFTVHSYDAYRLQASGRNDKTKRLSQWLASLPKPCALFSAYDHKAKHVIDVCRQTGIEVPAQISVLGVDNDTIICDQSIPSISSICPEFYKSGLLAAQMLDSLIRRPRKSPVKNTYGTVGIVERMSTADVRRTSRTVSLAQEFIRLHGTEGISVQAVASAAKTSVRYLEMNFRQVTGSTVIQAIQAVRLAKVCELLKITQTPISNIAKMAGFNNDNYLKNLFREKFGISMTRWRAENAC